MVVTVVMVLLLRALGVITEIKGFTWEEMIHEKETPAQAEARLVERMQAKLEEGLVKQKLVSQTETTREMASEPQSPAAPLPETPSVEVKEGRSVPAVKVKTKVTKIQPSGPTEGTDCPTPSSPGAGQALRVLGSALQPVAKDVGKFANNLVREE